MFKKILIILSVSISGIFFINMSEKARASTALNSDIRVDLDCAGADCGTMTLANSNTTRKLAVNSQGHIYAVFYGQNGVWVSKSTNRGQSFSSAKMVTSLNAQPEIGTSADGTVYVIWAESGNYVISKSTDGANTWSSPVTVGAASGPQAHMAVDGDYIYAVGQQGTTLYYSSNSGQTWSTTSVGSSQVFADVHVDPITHNVYVFTDNPSVFWYVSSDRGVTLSSRKTTGKSVFFSVGALTSTGSSKYFYMAGSESNLERINLSDETVETRTVSASAGSTTRSLAADSCGNVVSGHKSGADLYFQYSSDSGTTFSSEQLVVTSADRANASINPTNGDLMFLYEKGGDIFLTTYAGLFTGGSNCYAATISNTAIEFTAPGQTPSITLTNTSNTPLSVDNISISGNNFTVSHSCGSSIPANGSCVVSVSGSSQGSETLNITLGGTPRIIPVSLGAIASTRPAESTPPNTIAPPTTNIPESTESNNNLNNQIPEVSDQTPVVVDSPKNKVVRNIDLKDQEPTLPNTGSESSGILILSLILILLGSIFVAGKKISKPLL
jgi:LPXTG-motif cell wall-anchored protein